MANEGTHQTTTGQTAGMAGEKGAAQQSKGASTDTRAGTKSAGTATGATGAKGRAGGESLNDMAQNASRESRSGDEPTETKWGLPEDLDLDAADEELIKKILKGKKKLKINGKEQVVSLDEAFRYMQKDLSTHQRNMELQKAAEERDALIQALQANPAAVMEKLGHNFDELAKQRIAEKLRLQAMSEEQRAAYEERQKREQVEQSYNQLVQQIAQAQREQAKSASAQKWQSQIVDALEKSGIPIKHPMALKATAQFLAAERKAGNADVTAYDVMPRVKEFLETLSKSYISTMKPADILQWLGKEAEESIRQSFIDRVKDPMEPSRQTAAKPFNADPSSRRNIMNPDQFREELDKKFAQ